MGKLGTTENWTKLGTAKLGTDGTFTDFHSSKNWGNVPSVPRFPVPRFP
jgi:hypothetical protein